MSGEMSPAIFNAIKMCTAVLKYTKPRYVYFV
jgi:hypothetical protein